MLTPLYNYEPAGAPPMYFKSGIWYREQPNGNQQLCPNTTNTCPYVPATELNTISQHPGDTVEPRIVNLTSYNCSQKYKLWFDALEPIVIPDVITITSIAAEGEPSIPPLAQDQFVEISNLQVALPNTTSEQSFSLSDPLAIVAINVGPLESSCYIPNAALGYTRIVRRLNTTGINCTTFTLAVMASAAGNVQLLTNNQSLIDFTARSQAALQITNNRARRSLAVTFRNIQLNRDSRTHRMCTSMRENDGFLPPTISSAYNIFQYLKRISYGWHGRNNDDNDDNGRYTTTIDAGYDNDNTTTTAVTNIADTTVATITTMAAITVATTTTIAPTTMAATTTIAATTVPTTVAITTHNPKRRSLVAEISIKIEDISTLDRIYAGVQPHLKLDVTCTTIIATIAHFCDFIHEITFFTSTRKWKYVITEQSTAIEYLDHGAYKITIDNVPDMETMRVTTRQINAADLYYDIQTFEYEVPQMPNNCQPESEDTFQKIGIPIIISISAVVFVVLIGIFLYHHSYMRATYRYTSLS
jgi:hypothetical protein